MIAVIWDFDQTLIPGYQQKPLFQYFKVDEGQFWDEVDHLQEFYGQQNLTVSRDTIYLNHMLTYVKHGKFKGLSNNMLKAFGQELKFYPGLPDFFVQMKNLIAEDESFKQHNIVLEHYIVSTGLRQVIMGSVISPYIDNIWACEFIGEPAEPNFVSKATLPFDNPGDQEISQVSYFLDNTTKTRAIWEINKGANRDNAIGVNDLIAPEDRRVPIRNMIYIADGPSDIPVFAILNQQGGRTLGVYNPEQSNHFREVKKLSDQGRVQHFARADYSPHSDANYWITETVKEVAREIVRDRSRALSDRVRPSAKHISS